MCLWKQEILIDLEVFKHFFNVLFYSLRYIYHFKDTFKLNLKKDKKWEDGNCESDRCAYICKHLNMHDNTPYNEHIQLIILSSHNC